MNWTIRIQTKVWSFNLPEQELSFVWSSQHCDPSRIWFSTSYFIDELLMALLNHYRLASKSAVIEDVSISNRSSNIKPASLWQMLQRSVVHRQESAFSSGENVFGRYANTSRSTVHCLPSTQIITTVTSYYENVPIKVLSPTSNAV